MRKHECNCPQQPDCDEHRAREFGGGEPDVCEPHGHGLLWAALMAQAAFVLAGAFR